LEACRLGGLQAWRHRSTACHCGPAAAFARPRPAAGGPGPATTAVRAFLIIRRAAPRCLPGFPPPFAPQAVRCAAAPALLLPVPAKLPPREGTAGEGEGESSSSPAGLAGRLAGGHAHRALLVAGGLTLLAPTLPSASLAPPSPTARRGSPTRAFSACATNAPPATPSSAPRVSSERPGLGVQSAWGRGV
jgi:hypothetical protein